jgi:hypothetical protein
MMTTTSTITIIALSAGAIAVDTVFFYFLLFYTKESTLNLTVGLWRNVDDHRLLDN